MSVLFDSCFLHDGHIGGRSSSFGARGFGSGVASPFCVAGVDSTDRPDNVAELVSKVHFTGMRFFRLHANETMYQQVKDQRMSTTHRSGCAGLPPWHVVWIFTSERDVGGPCEVYVGVRDGSQKSGSLLFSASACSRSI